MSEKFKGVLSLMLYEGGKKYSGSQFVTVFWLKAALDFTEKYS